MPKLGRKPDDYSKPKLDLTELAVSGDFPPLPAVQQNTQQIRGQLLMLGNGPDPMFGPNFDGAGDCESARCANHRLLMTGSYPAPKGPELVKWLMDIYKTQNPDFDPNGDPNVNGPGSPADGGMSTDTLLSYLHTTGTPDGTKVIAYGTIDPTNVEAVERAISIFGAVWLDILVQPGNQQEFARRQPWTNTGEPPEGGHAVLSGDYVPQREIVTWADIAELAESFWSGTTQQGPLVERVYLVIWPEHATKEFIASPGAAQLAVYYKELTGKELVWPTPPAPVPTPTPTPPGPGASFLVTDPAVVDRIVAASARRQLTPDSWLTRHLEHYFKLADLAGEELL